MFVDIRPTSPTQDSARQNVALQIVSVVMSTFIGYLTISILLTVLFGYVHDDLGYGSVPTDLVISLQYLATLLARSYAGRVVDGLGPKRAVLYGMAGSVASGLFMLLLVAIQDWPVLGLASLLVSRLVFGAVESLIDSAVIGWGIGRAGAPHTARVIPWNGIVGYGIAVLGTPLGVLLAQWLGLWSMGMSIVLLGTLGLALAWPKLPAPLVYGEQLSFHHVLDRIIPHDMGPALGAIGFGTIAAFITLYYVSRGWVNAVFYLSAFGGCLIGAQLLSASSINRLGGSRVAIICLGVENFSLLLLWSAPNPWVGLAGAAFTGFGFFLVFPVFGMEAVNLVPASNRGAALGACSLSVDLPLGITGPPAGFVANLFGFRSTFLFACLTLLGGLVSAVALHRRSRRPGWGVHRPRRRYAF